MENAAAAGPCVEAVDIAITGSIAATALMANTTTTAAVAKAKLKAKVKKEVTAMEGGENSEALGAVGGQANKEG
jgi:hypothetical protein